MTDIITLIPELHAKEYNPYTCPKCGRNGQWRRGVPFENEKICMKCHFTWDPSELATELSIYVDGLLLGVIGSMVGNPNPMECECETCLGFLGGNED